MQPSNCMWQSKESKLKAKDKKVYGFTKNQRCKGLLLDPQGMVQKLSYRFTLHGKCQPNCIIRDAEKRECSRVFERASCEISTRFNLLT